MKPVANLPQNAELIEPGPLDTFALVVGNNDAHDPPAVRQLLAVNLDDFAGDGLQLAGAEFADAADISQVIVGARKVEDQIADGVDAELGKQVGARWADALEILHGLRQIAVVERAG